MDLICAENHTEIAFSQNVTNFFHLFAYHLGRNLHEGDHIIITETDNHAKVNPWSVGIFKHNWIETNISSKSDCRTTKVSKYRQGT
ncbi:aminotransferase class V-fold PLP-dependent enzyme [Sporosarcina sp. D27]|uniref:aminotransferase class V-fold PLP-dependent enzyme n=1 Tax=Sporosarcina sp. D27 TaxID=1382305 RepID=UPI00155B18E3